MYRILFVAIVTGLLWSCGDDDNGVPGEVIPPRLLADQIGEDDAEIQEFLQTHFYNYEEFQTPPENFDFRIRIDSIAGDNADKIPLSEQVSMETITASSFQFPLSVEENDIPHTYYYLVAREGEGTNPTTADSVLVTFEGRLLNGEGFDASTSLAWLTQSSNIRGFANGLSKMKTGTLDGLDQRADGSTSFTNSGIGLVIFPSGLGYFNAPPPGAGIPGFAPLIFTFSVGLTIEGTDTDNDGIPDLQEDLNGNDYFFDDNTDANLEFLATANFRDPDDDGDGILTRDEITIDPETGAISFPDSDGDGTPDYLDNDDN